MPGEHAHALSDEQPVHVGAAIRLDVSSSNFPRPDVNPNTGEAIGQERRRVLADNTVCHERGQESRVVLPIIPTESSKAEPRRPS
jgi:predicted acyl esterase